MLRTETKARARAVQILYAWEAGGEPPVAVAATGLARLTGPEPAVFERAERYAEEVVAGRPEIDRLIAEACEHWRMERIGAIERNILRLGVHELREGDVSPRTAIDEAVKLARWFGGVRSPAFVNGVLDRVARALGRL